MPMMAMRAARSARPGSSQAASVVMTGSPHCRQGAGTMGVEPVAMTTKPRPVRYASVVGAV